MISNTSSTAIHPFHRILAHFPGFFFLEWETFQNRSKGKKKRQILHLFVNIHIFMIWDPGRQMFCYLRVDCQSWSFFISFFIVVITFFLAFFWLSVDLKLSYNLNQKAENPREVHPQDQKTSLTSGNYQLSIIHHSEPVSTRSWHHII